MPFSSPAKTGRIPAAVESSPHIAADQQTTLSPEALEALTEQFLPMALGFARRFGSRNRQHADDYRSAAQTALLAAARTYEPAKGAFGSWAKLHIKHEVLSEVRAQEFPELTVRQFKYRPRVIAAMRELSAAGTHRPSAEAVAFHADLPLSLVEPVMRHHRNARFPEAELIDETLQPTHRDTPPPADAYDQVVQAQDAEVLLAAGIAQLDWREQLVLTDSFGLHGGEPRSLADLGRELGITRQSTSQIQRRALDKLAHPIVLRKLVRPQDVVLPAR